MGQSNNQVPRRSLADGTSDVRFYGSMPISLQKALAKTLVYLSSNRTYCFFWESEDAVTSINGYSSFLLECADLSPAIQVHAVFVRLLASRPTRKVEKSLTEWSFPFDLTTLLTTPAAPLDQIQKAVRKELLAATADFKKRELNELAHHAAARPLWLSELARPKIGQPLKQSTLVIDDRVACPGTEGFQKCLTIAGMLESWGWDVLLSKSIEDVVEGNFKRLRGLDCLSDDQHFRATESFDVIFVDIVRESPVDGVGRLELDGIRRDLAFLSRGRSVLPFPQIFMLSNLPRDLIAHVCHALGADYYFEKQEFLHSGETEFCRTLAHTIHVARGNSTEWVKNAVVTSPDTQNWMVEELFGKDSAKEAVSRRNCVWELSARLYSAAYELTGLRLVQKYNEGFSGALTLEVEPVTPQGKQKRRVLKIANTYEMARELAAYAQYIQPFVSTGFARIEPHWAVAGGEAAISYEYAGDRVNSKTQTLLKVLSESSSDWKMGHVMRVLRFVRLLHRQNVVSSKPHNEMDIWRFFRSDFAGHHSIWSASPSLPIGEEFEILRVRGSHKGVPENALIGSLCLDNVGDLATWLIETPDAALGPGWMIRPGKRFFGIRPQPSGILVSVTRAINDVLSDKLTPTSVKDRLYAARQYIENLKLDMKVEDLAKSSFTTHAQDAVSWGVVHADLHLKNIMVEHETKSLWVIDYGKTRPGPPAIDYLVLEHDFRRQFLMPLLGEKLNQCKLDPLAWCEQVSAYARTMETQLLSVRQSGESVWQALALSDQEAELVALSLRKIRIIRRAARLATAQTRAKSKEDSRVLLLSETLYMLRTLQTYKNDAKAVNGPVGLIWAAEVMAMRLSQLE